MKRRRRKWKAPNNPTVQARQIWRAVYGEPWPKGWKVKWVGFMRGASGLTSYAKREILINYGDAKAQPTDLPAQKGSYLRAMAMAFWHSLYRRFDYGSDLRDIDTESYLWWARIASARRIEMARHTTLERGAIEVLLHEFVHVRQGPGLKHGKEFDRLVEWSRAKLTEARL
jgi:hypothetical protein